MKNKKTMIVKLDWQNIKVLNENLNTIVNNFVAVGVDFELVLIDAENYIIDSNINAIVNQYIADCKKKKTPLAVDIKLLNEFIVKIMDYNSKQAASPIFYSPKPDEIPFDIVAPNGRSFRVYIPKKLISDEKYDKLLHLGSDYVMGGLSKDILFNYVLSPFYWFLYQNDLLGDEKCSDLCKYMYGLA